MKLALVSGSLDLYIREINRFPLLSPEEEFKLAIRLKKYGDMNAAQTLIVSNLRFVVKIAHEYRNYNLKLADLIQEGNVGLIHAVKKFDPYKGYRLISYAVWWIRAYIQNYLIKSWSLVKIGTTQAQRKLFFKLNQVKRQIATMAKKIPEFSEIAASLGVKCSEVQEMDIRMGSRDLSLQTLISDDDTSTHIDFLVFGGDSQEVELIKNEEKSLIQRNIAGALANLSERESYIIQNRVMADTPQTLQEIGDRYSVTRERVRQIEKQALKKVRSSFPQFASAN